MSMMISISNGFYCCLILITINSFPSAHAVDTISSYERLSDSHNDTLISPRSKFELGFFSPESSTNRYLGIWYKNITPRTVVWLANRDNPLTDSSGKLTLIGNGRLLLQNAANATVWSTNHNTSSSTNTTFVARLLDSGNLVVTDADGNFLWQSFDNPTDTLLQGMKLGWNFATNHQVYLSSGDFTLHFDPTGYPQHVIMKGDSVIFKSGPWNGVGFSGSPSLKKNTVFAYGVVMTETEVYYHYEQLEDSLVTRFTLTETGVVERYVWFDRTQSWTLYHTVQIDKCDIYNACGAHGSCNADNSVECACLSKFQPKDALEWNRHEWSRGCVRAKPLNCSSGDVFLKYSGIKLPDTRSSWFNTSMSLEDCREVCSRNCSCMAYASLDISSGNGCLLWFGDLVNIRQMSPSGQDIYIRLASSELDSKGKKRVIIPVSLSLVVGVFLVCLSLFLYLKRRKRLHQQLPEIVLGRRRLNNPDDDPRGSQNKDLELPQFELSTIVKATDNFSLKNKLGEGGFGPVYKGLLDEGREIAVKRLSKTSLQGVDEFKNEVICIAKLQHRNLVKLLGWCVQGSEKMLVYEYMINRSLNLILFNPTKSMLLDWPMRFNIINGIARGLMYLHQDSCLRVIHRDLKASNILLDSDMNPKISDFGLARTFGGNETGANTNKVVGTLGYMSPEYAMHGMFSVKSDVFSFGVLVLEIISGKRNRGYFQGDHRLNLLEHAWILDREDRWMELVDSCVRDSCCLSDSEVKRAIHVGLLCVQEHPEDRPSMCSVVMMLSSDGVLGEAKHPGFFTGRDLHKSEGSNSSNTLNISTNTITITELEGR